MGTDRQPSETMAGESEENLWLGPEGLPIRKSDLLTRESTFSSTGVSFLLTLLNIAKKVTEA